MQYSPLWLDPSSLPPEHEYYQASYVRENERGQEDALALLAYAFAQGEERGEDEEGEGDKASSAASSAAGHFADEAARSTTPLPCWVIASSTGRPWRWGCR